MNDANIEQVKKKNIWYGKIETKEEALKIIKDTSTAFYVLAVLQIAVGYFLIGVGAIIDGVLFATGAFLLKRFNSRIVAIVLLFLASFALVSTLLNKITDGSGGQIFLWPSLLFGLVFVLCKLYTNLTDLARINLGLVVRIKNGKYTN